MSDELAKCSMIPAREQQAVKDLLDKIMERMANDSFISVRGSRRQGPRRPRKLPPRGPNIGQSRNERQPEARFEITDKTDRFSGIKNSAGLLGSLGRSSFGRHDTRDLSTGVESGGVSRSYEFGDILNMTSPPRSSIAVRREGPKVPIE